MGFGESMESKKILERINKLKKSLAVMSRKDDIFLEHKISQISQNKEIELPNDRMILR